MISCILAVLCGLFIILVDQLTKYYVSSDLVLGEVHDFLNGLINIVFVENRGAAWGMFSGNKIFLFAVTAVAMIACVIVLIKLGTKNKLLFWALCVVIAGGLGNIIDRVFRNGVVVDFLQFDFWQSFPVFNIADCAIVIGGALMMLYVIIDIFKDSKKKKNKVRK